MHHRSSGICLRATLFCLAAAGCSLSNNGGGSNGGNTGGGTNAVAGTTSGGGSQGFAGASGGDSTPDTSAGGSTEPVNTGGSTEPESTGGSTEPESTGGSTSPDTTAAGGSGGAASSSTTSAVAGSRDAGAGGSGGFSPGGSSGNRDAGPAGGTAAGGTGGKATGGSATGGSATGGKATGGSATGGSATGGSAGTNPAGKVFSQCRFHFGTIDSQAKNAGASMISQLDYFTPGWMMGTFNQKYVCDESAPGGALAGLVPVDVTYIAANYVKGQNKLCDCNVSGCAGGNLCNYGAQYITQDWATILSQYTSNSTGFSCLNGRPIVFEMEPDWYQYYAGGQTQAWTPAQAGTNMTALVTALKSSLPNAVFSMDISPWIPNNGSAWYTNFNMSLFTFVNTSGGGTAANSTKIRTNNAMTWAGVHGVTGKPILADTGYGANGGSAGHDAAWDVVANINARIADGVVSIAQYNPVNTWGSTISGIRSQLSTPSICP